MRQRRELKGLWGPLRSSVHRAITLVIWEKAHCPLSTWVHQAGVSFPPLCFVWPSVPTQVSSCFTTGRSCWSAGLEGLCGWESSHSEMYLRAWLKPISYYKLRCMTLFSKGAFAKHSEHEMQIRAPDHLRLFIPENVYCLECQWGGQTTLAKQRGVHMMMGFNLT